MLQSHIYPTYMDQLGIASDLYSSAVDLGVKDIARIPTYIDALVNHPHLNILLELLQSTYPDFYSTVDLLELKSMLDRVKSGQFSILHGPLLTEWIWWIEEATSPKLELSYEVAADYFFICLELLNIFRHIRGGVLEESVGVNTKTNLLALASTLSNLFAETFPSKDGIMQINTMITAIRELTYGYPIVSAQNGTGSLNLLLKLLGRLKEDPEHIFASCQVHNRPSWLCVSELRRLTALGDRKIHLVTAYASGALLFPWLAKQLDLPITVECCFLDASTRRQGGFDSYKERMLMVISEPRLYATKGDIILCVDDATGRGRTLTALGIFSRDKYPDSFHLDPLANNI